MDTATANKIADKIKVPLREKFSPAHDELLPVATGYCKCGACGEYFIAFHSFDTHRVGVGSDRACLDSEAMLRKGFSRIKAEKGEYWVYGNER